jgi:putative alpha-1,2-mannosidase
MIKKSILFICAAFAAAYGSISETDYCQWVDTLIGSGGHGHVFVGACLPHGMVQIVPNNLTRGWDWCSGYHDSDSTIVGFTHTHLSGTGIADLGDIAFMPVCAGVPLTRGIAEDLASGYASTFRKEAQVVRPGYYSVMLDRYGIRAELTAHASEARK